MMKHIFNSKLVDDLFGYWPEFCDARITLFSVSHLPKNVSKILLTLSYIDSGQSIGAEIKLEFSRVSSIQLNELMNENVLDQLAIRPLTGEELEIELTPCCGLVGSFKCKQAKVISVTPFEG